MVRSEDRAETCILKGHVEDTTAWWVQVVMSSSRLEAFSRSKKPKSKTTATQASIEQAASTAQSIRRCRKVAVAGPQTLGCGLVDSSVAIARGS